MDSIKQFPGVKVVRIKDFLAVTAEDEWSCVRAMRALVMSLNESLMQAAPGGGIPASAWYPA